MHGLRLGADGPAKEFVTPGSIDAVPETGQTYTGTVFRVDTGTAVPFRRRTAARSLRCSAPATIMDGSMRASTYRSVKTTLVLVAGWGIAVLAFPASGLVPGISPSWRIQFAVIVAIASLFQLAAVWIPRDGVAPAVLCVAAGFQVMAEMALGPEMAVVYILAAAFVYVAMTSFAGASRFVASVAYALLVAFVRGNVAAWESDLASPDLAARLFFLLFVGLEMAILEKAQSAERRAENLERRIAGLNRNINALTSVNIDFQEYATRVQRESQEAERKRITREIHDIVGYTLMNVQMMMEAALDLHGSGSPELPALIAKARDQTQRGLLETRNAMRALRALAEPQTSGLRGLYDLARIFEHATKVKVDFNPGNCPERFGPVLEDILRRLVQESLTNAFRHGNAGTVVVNLWKTDDTLQVAIHDDGVGSPNIVPGIGITGMRERLASVGGELTIRDSGRGFSILAEMPYPLKEREDVR